MDEKDLTDALRAEPSKLLGDIENIATEPLATTPSVTKKGTAETEFVLTADGVFEQRNGEHFKLCAPLRVVARTRGGAEKVWGRRLQWTDDDGDVVTRTFLENVKSDDLESELRLAGLWIRDGRGAGEQVLRYIRSQDAPRIRTVERSGWNGDVYVTPSGQYGESAEPFELSFDARADAAWECAGTSDRWKERIGWLCQGNSRLVFAVSMAFAAPLFEIAGQEPGGIHFIGASSTGKTVALRVAASVYGNPERLIRSWNSTANGIEGMAARSTDALLIMDEIGQAQAAGNLAKAVYMLANGLGKTRMNADARLRETAKLRVPFLSTGEVGLEEYMRNEGGRAPAAGQIMRLGEIPCDLRYGIFETLNGVEDGKALAVELETLTKRTHGAPMHDWLTWLAKERANLKQELRGHVAKMAADIAGEFDSQQVGRMASRCALIALAGEHATRLGLTGWVEGEAFNAAKACFEAWSERYGKDGSKEERTLVDDVRRFFQQHGASRFESLEEGESSGRVVINRVGFYNASFYYVPAQMFQVVCGGHDTRRAAKTLVRVGILKPGNDGKNAQSIRLPRLKTESPSRCYVFSADALAGDP